MSETYEIINGQPQNHPNKMVTYEGLEDFRKMLKNEIPRMGTNNIIETPLSKRNYAFGKDNTITADTDECCFALGGENTLDKAHYSFVHGFVNKVLPTNEGAKSSFGYALGNNNRVKGDYVYSFGWDNYLAGKYAFINGNNNEVNGEGMFVFGGGNGCYHKDTKYCYVLGNGNQIGIEPDGSIVQAQNHIYAFGDYGWFSGTTSNKPLYFFGQYSEKNVDYPNVCIVIGNGTANEARNNLFQINYDGTVYDEYDDSLYARLETPKGDVPSQTFQLGHLRHSMKAFANDEAEWLIADNKDTLQINRRERKSNVPKTIEFHAGGETKWANIKCNQLVAHVSPFSCTSNLNYCCKGQITDSVTVSNWDRNDLPQPGLYFVSTPGASGLVYIEDLSMVKVYPSRRTKNASSAEPLNLALQKSNGAVSISYISCGVVNSSWASGGDIYIYPLLLFGNW